MYVAPVLTIDLDYDAIALALAERLQPAASPWLTVAQAAEHIGASERWFRDRLYDIPHSRVEGRIFVDRRELDAWLTASRA
jgi:hypothetical protein